MKQFQTLFHKMLVEDNIAPFFKSADEEKDFYEHYYKSFITVFRLSAFVGALIYASFIITDFFISPKIFPALLFNRLSICVLAIVGVILSFTTNFKKYSQIYLFLYYNIVVVALMHLYSLQIHLYPSIYALMIFFSLMLSIKATYHAITTVIIIILYYYVSVTYHNLSVNLIYLNIALYFASALVCLIGIHIIQILKIKNFKQLRKLSDFNENLEKMVHDRTTCLEKSNKELEIEKEKAQAANRTKTEFLSNLTHELRTPINGVIGTSELLIQSENSSDKKEMLSMIHHSGRTLLDLYTNLIELANIEAGKVKLERHIFNIHETLNKSAERFHHDALAKEIDFKISIGEDIPSQLSGDKFKLSKMFSHLINNAVKYTEKGAIYLTLELEETIVDQCKFRFSVADTGIGIDDSKLKAIFDSFTQEETFSSKQYPGVGVGLTIVKYIAELFGGSISVQSQKNRGSTFIVFFTLAIPCESTQQ